MAIYHLHAGVVQRSKGQSVVAAAAYRHAAKMRFDKESKVFNYTNKEGVIYKEVLIPSDSPQWIRDLVSDNDADKASEKLWNIVEQGENRSDSQLARDVEFSIPIELDKDQGIALVKEFVKDQLVSRGMVADVVIHWDHGNPHAHILLTMRPLTIDGFGKKVVSWNSKALLCDVRLKWSEYANYHLRLHGHEVRIDHRSNKDRGIDLEPGVHEGKAVNDMNRRGIFTERKKRADWVRNENLTRIVANPEAFLKKMQEQRSTFTNEDVAQSLGSYINDKGNFSFIDSEYSDNEDSTVPVLSADIISKLLSTIESHNAVFDDKALANAIAPYTDNGEQFAKAIIQIKSSGDLIPLGIGDDGRERYTTRKMFAVENEIQDLADALVKQKHHVISDKQVDSLLANYQSTTGKELKGEQLDAVKHILGVKSIACVVGRAGTGKSFSLGAAKAVWEGAGLNVYGVALSGIAADGLEKDAGFDSRTIASFLLAIKQGNVVLNAKSVVVMDEAGMADSESLLAVLKAAVSANAKLVLVGDHGQLQPVGPGAAFRALLERVRYKELTVIRRQNYEWQRTATSAMASGSVADGLTAYAKEGCVHLDDDSFVAKARLVEDWFATRATSDAALKEYLVVAHTNEDVNQLNDLIRHGRVTRGEIAPGYKVKANARTIQLAKGDRLLFTKNDRRLGVKNGRFATVVSVNFAESGQVIDFTVCLDGSDKLVTVNPSRFNHFALGYAATVHKIQGVTVQHAFVYVAGIWDRCLSYVGLSRHKESCHVYGGKDNYADEKVLGRSMGSYGMKDSVLDFPLAFAERHGIDTSFLERLLPEHLAERLSAVVTRVKDRYAQVITPNAYRRDQAEKEQAEAESAKYREKILKIIERRKDAPHVAAYCDASQDVGVAWGLLQVKLLSLGFESISYIPEDFEVISALPEYKVFMEAMAQRNALAYPIVHSPKERYEVALDSNNVDLEKLAKHAESHACLLRAERYLALKVSGNMVLRDRLAAEICRDLKLHYSTLKALGIDTKALRSEGLHHVRQQRFLTLSVEERQAFRTVERYRALVAQCGSYYAEHIKGKAGESGEDKLVVAPHYIATLKALSAERDRLAWVIAESPELYAEALHFNHVGSAQSHFGEEIKEDYLAKVVGRLEKLQTYAKRHACLLMVENYVALLASCEDDVLRDSQAALIMRDIKGCYPFLKELLVDTKELRDIGLLHERREFLLGLTPDEARAFVLVEQYRQVVAASGAYYAEHMKPPSLDAMDAQLAQDGAPLAADVSEPKHDAQVAAFHVINQARMNNERDRLAADILANRVDAEKSFAFHHIGSALGHFDSEVSEKQQQQAVDRLTKLEVHAERHRFCEKILAYAHEADITQRLALAFEIKQNTKGHFAAMMRLGVDNTEGQFWIELSQNAKRYERLQFCNKLDLVERIAFKTVEAYVEAKRQHGLAWRDLFAQRGKVSEDAFNEMVLRLADPYTKQRNHLAAEMLAQPVVYEKYLAYFTLDAKELVAPAASHGIYDQVARFVSEPSLVKRGYLAQAITLDPKAYHGELRKQGVSWKDVNASVKIAERHQLFVGIEPLEAKLLRLGAKYRAANKAFGQAFAQFKAVSDVKQKSHYQTKINILAARRDALAVKLNDIHRMVELSSYVELIKENPKVKASFVKRPFDWEKIAKQAAVHKEKVQVVECYREASNRSQAHLASLLSSEQVPFNFNRMLNWMIFDEEEDLAQQIKKIALGKGSYSVVLQAYGLTTDRILHQQTSYERLISDINKRLNVADQVVVAPRVLQAEDHKRLADVQKIVAGSKAIEGSLAMRYLREHRGIQGELNGETLLFHPNLKNWMKGSYHPALIVLARDASNKVCGLQAIFLDPETANKAKLGNCTKLSRGFTGEGALIHQGNARGKVAFAEGPETALSIAEANPDWSVYCTFGVGNFDKVPLKTKAQSVVLCADNDGPCSGTELSVEKSALRLAEKGLDVWVAMPDKPSHASKWDFNDALLQQGAEQVRENLQNAGLNQQGVSAMRLEQAMMASMKSLVQAVPREVDVEIPKRRMMEAYDLHSIVRRYVEKELKHAELVADAPSLESTDLRACKEFSFKVKRHSDELMALAKAVMTNPAVKAELAAFAHTTDRPTAKSIEQLGGYQAMKTQFDQGEFSQEVIQSVLTEITEKVTPSQKTRLKSMVKVKAVSAQKDLSSDHLAYEQEMPLASFEGVMPDDVLEANNRDSLDAMSEWESYASEINVSQVMPEAERQLVGDKLLVTSDSLEREVNAEIVASQVAEEIVVQNVKPDIERPVNEAKVETVEEIVMKFVNLAIKQTALMDEKLEAMSHNDGSEKEAARKAVEHGNEVAATAAEMLKNPAIAEEAKGKCWSDVGDRGGFPGIKERFDAGEFNKDDIKAVISQMQSRVASRARTLAQAKDRGRGGRTQ